MKEKYLDQIKKFYGKFRRLPTYSEMAKLLGFSSRNSAFRIMQKWISYGLVQKINNKISPTSQFFALPLYGLVKAGYPIMAEENKEYLTIDEYLIGDPTSTFLLKVSGDSMINAGIFEGDIVVIDNKKEAKDGDIVLAEVDREWTLKFLKRDKKLSFLRAANEKYPDIHPREELKIRGIVKGVVRKFHS
ncbi:repressor LexA [Candidatus Roizmanbacteria bacterium RIFCSPLOWO2_01_FULL_41_22]|uniref:Repressor LexA n=2 Tax=Candidatus Roizmaniibacteriota TaxID=1752723 RepID=A0A1F7JQN3_9BACT|nr:MAG: repressor LexA [Candidatus Roizmanbacteria bacterium RIFCSPLOWO2_01_FULL_41_22]OGK57933.1 MAG: repressor LexA [Candidatus Roizmanbacteria bacterium RIFCSPLOWO2_02_FULL_41_9]